MTTSVQNPKKPQNINEEMRAAMPADPARAKVAAVERLGDEDPAVTHPTKSLDDALPVRTQSAARRVHRDPNACTATQRDSCP